MVAVPLLPSAEAVIVADPLATAVTSPVLLLTVAARGLLLDQVIVTARTTLAVSFAVAVSCNVSPGAIVPLRGATSIVAATGTGSLPQALTATVC